MLTVSVSFERSWRVLSADYSHICSRCGRHCRMCYAPSSLPSCPHAAALFHAMLKCICTTIRAVSGGLQQTFLSHYCRIFLHPFIYCKPSMALEQAMCCHVTYDLFHVDHGIHLVLLANSRFLLQTLDCLFACYLKACGFC